MSKKSNLPRNDDGTFASTHQTKCKQVDDHLLRPPSESIVQQLNKQDSLDRESTPQYQSEADGEELLELTMAEQEPSAAALMKMIVDLMEQNKKDEEKRKGIRNEERKEDLAKAQKQREQDIERIQENIDEENIWKKMLAESKDKQVRADHAIRSFPKISNRDLLPTHLENFTDLMDSCGVAGDARTCRLPEVLTELAGALQNLKLSANTPFPEAKQQLLRAVDFTAASAARTFLSPDTDVLKVMGSVDLMNHVESLVTRFISGVTTVEDVKLKLLLAFMNNVGSRQCVSALVTKEIMSRGDLRDAVIAVFDNHGSIVDDEKNVSTLFSSLLKKREPSNCFKPTGSRLPDLFQMW